MLPQQVEIPQKLLPLFQPKRWKIVYGGRSGAKSWSIARALLSLGASRPLLIVCGRETQNSIADSVKSLLDKQISELNLEHFYASKDQEIIGANGTQIIFKGLREQDIKKLKSLEGADILWIEEAQSLTVETWRVISPTIRKPGSEIWVSFNPELEDDATYQRCVTSPPADAWICKVGWQDNPWHTIESERERLDTLHRDPESYANIWDGECRSIVVGAIFQNELVAARNEGRITKVPHDPILPVHTFWDLGVGPQCAIWLVQAVGSEVRVINYVEGGEDEGMPHFVSALNKFPYNYGNHWAPHDIQVREFGSGRSRVETARRLGISFKMVPRAGSGEAEALEERIHAAKMIFPRCWFDSEGTRLGVKKLGLYRRGYNATLGELKPTPVHDMASHAADAFGHMAVSLKEAIVPNRYVPPPSLGVGGWMG
jgi:phage terminase large subunit